MSGIKVVFSLAAAITVAGIGKSFASPSCEEEIFQTGSASWYGPGFQNNKTANGERFNQHEVSAAHKTLPFNQLVKVTIKGTGKSLIVRINDRGPYVKGRIIDLSRKAADKLGFIEEGTAPVELRLCQ